MNIHQHIIAGIKEQLFLNDYLVLPNFGGFVLKTQRASYTAGGFSLLPPSKTVGFNVQLKQNDGILTHWLQDQLKCSKSEATQHLLDFSNFCSGVLQSKRRLSLAGIGFFYLDFENNICFEPANDNNFNTDSFGLSAVQLNPISEETKIDKAIERTPKFEDRPATTATEAVVKRKINYRKTAYLTLFLVTLSSVLILLVTSLNVKGVMQSSLFLNKGKSLYTPIEYKDLELKQNKSQSANLVADNNGIAVFEINAQKNISVNVFDAQQKNAVSGNIVSKYEIILGCFKKMKNAKRLVEQLKKNNIDAKIKENNYKGMHVVAVLGINDKVDAIDALEVIQGNYPKAWLKVN